MRSNFQGEGTSSSPCFTLSLAQARKTIVSSVSALPGEQVALSEALSRVTVVPLLASLPKPFYAQSTRDGFALSGTAFSVDKTSSRFQLVGEIAAGSVAMSTLRSGEAVRIMTGGMIPSGCNRVVPFEGCQEGNGLVTIAHAEIQGKQRYIRHVGSEHKAGDLLVDAGVHLQPDHLRVLAENGLHNLFVCRRPEIAVLCTGSELVDVGETTRPGKKVSGNGILLSSLLRLAGARCRCSLTVGDDVEAIQRKIEWCLDTDVDMIITTGGMGPGKYDLMQQVFDRLQGDMRYNQLMVRPGKSTLFGMVGKVPFFALPGPPPAVRILFYELIMPALAWQQGLEQMDHLLTALLDTSLAVQQAGEYSLKSAVASCDDQGRLRVRPAGRGEPVGAIIHLDGGTQMLHRDDRVKIRLVGPLQGLAG